MSSAAGEQRVDHSWAETHGPDDPQLAVIAMSAGHTRVEMSRSGARRDGASRPGVSRDGAGRESKDAGAFMRITLIVQGRDVE